MKYNNLKQYIDKVKKDEEIFVHALSSPSFQEATIRLLEKFDLFVEINDIKVKEQPIKIDSDGYPYIEASVSIDNLNIKLNMITYHRDYWDFYIG